MFRKKRHDPTADDSFKKTKFVHKIDEDAINLDKIRELLNKLTKTNYDEISKDIVIHIQHFIFSKNQEILVAIGNSIFDISSINKFWVELYAKLYNELIQSFSVMREICMTNFESYLEVFDNIKLGDEKDYDEFCKINKMNDKRRALTKFYTYLYKYDILKADDIFTILHSLTKKMNSEIQNKQIDVLEEIFENINIILINIGKAISSHTSYKMRCNDLINIYNVLNKNNISKKIQFKLIDLFEELDIDQ